MKVKDLDINLQLFKNFFNSKADISIKKHPDVYIPRKNWFLPGERNQKVPASDFPGVYLYLYKNRVIYVGKSEGKMGERVFSHLGAPNWDEMEFPYHQWACAAHPDPKMADEFAEACAAVRSGKIEIVSIVVKPGYFAPALESFLLSRREKPLLNL